MRWPGGCERGLVVVVVSVVGGVGAPAFVVVVVGRVVVVVAGRVAVVGAAVVWEFEEAGIEFRAGCAARSEVPGGLVGGVVPIAARSSVVRGRGSVDAGSSSLRDWGSTTWS